MWRFDRTELRPGDWLHVRGTSFVARFIRRGLNRMVRRLCEQHGIEKREIWGNHDGLLIPKTSQAIWHVGEALGTGNQLTPLTAYEKSINDGKEQVRVYRCVDNSGHHGIHAAANWMVHIKGRPYDYRGLFNLWIKSMFPFVKRVREWEWANWCTEGCGAAYREYNPPALDIMQTRHPTPMTVEQCAGELPHKDGKRITLMDVTDQVLKKVSA